MSPRARVRPLAVAAVRRADGAVLVQRGSDSRGVSFHRLVGGGIEFGESAAEAVAREFEEELGARLRDVRLLGWVENRFVLDGRPGHELVAVHVASITQRRLLDQDDLGTVPGSSSTVHWVSAGELLDGGRPLVPAGVVPLLVPWLAGWSDARSAASGRS